MGKRQGRKGMDAPSGSHAGPNRADAVRRGPGVVPWEGRRPVPLVWLAPLVLTLACGGGDTLNPPPPIADSALYWSLDLNHHAATMALTAPYDTLQLVATPHNRHGEAL